MKDTLREHGLYYAVIAVSSLIIFIGLLLSGGLSLPLLVLCAGLIGSVCAWEQTEGEK